MSYTVHQYKVQSICSTESNQFKYFTFATLDNILTMKTFTYPSIIVGLVVMMTSVSAFVPSIPSSVVQTRSMSTKPTTLSMAKYKTMDEILALFPDDKPVLINFYDL